MGKTLGDIVDRLIDLKFNQQALIRKTASGLYVCDTQDIETAPFVELQIAPKDPEYGIIHVTKETRGFFPGYRRQFVLETDTKPFVMHLVGAPNGTAVGDEEGGYLCHPRSTEIDSEVMDDVSDACTNEGSFLRFYEQHSHVQPGDYLKVVRVSPRLYQLRI